MYVNADAVPTIATVGIAPTVIALIGQGIGFHTYTETVSFASSNEAVLTKKGIDPSSLVVTGQVTDPAAPTQTITSTFAADAAGTPADYSTTVDATAGLDESVVTLVRTTTGAIETAHPAVTVTYRYTDADYHALHGFEDYDSLTEVYGQSLDPLTGEIQSPLSLAAQIAMENGANQLYTVALSGVGTLEQQFIAAYQLLAGNYSANVVVPVLAGLTDGAAIVGLLQSLKGLVHNEAADGYLRVLIAGFDRSYDPTTSDLAAAAALISSPRVIMAWPNRFILYNGVINQAIEADGFYLAAAYAGMLASQTPQTPLTRKYPSSFAGMPTAVAQQQTKTVKNQLSSAGLCVTELDRSGRLVVRHGLTTHFSGGVLNREISLVRGQDALYNLIQDTLDSAGLIGLPITEDTGLRVKSITQGGLEQAKIGGLINDYTGLKVRQQEPPTGDPTVIEVKFAYRPAWPLNYVLVSFTVDTSTGNSTLTTSTTVISDAASTAAAATASTG